MTTPMEIIPVLDLKKGQVVRGIAGQREKYQPVVSKVVQSADPLEVARAFRKHFGLFHLYVADLDAIEGKPPALEIFQALLEDGFQLWVDSGLKTAVDASLLVQLGIEGIIAGLETMQSPAALLDLVQQIGPDKTIFSLDLQDGIPISSGNEWKNYQPMQIAEKLNQLGISQVILLDLARVGMGTGTGTEDLCRQISEQYPNFRLIAGGGIRSLAQLEDLRQKGVAGVLIASALHDGLLTASDLKNFH